MGKISIIVSFLILAFSYTYSSAPPLFAELETESFQNKYSHLHRPKLNIIPEYRLDRTVIPVHYDLEIQPILSEDPSVGQRFTAPGRVSITIKAQNDAKHITFQSITINITESTIRVLDVEENVEQEIISTGAEESKQLYTVYLLNQLRPGKTYILSMDFVAPIAQDRQNGLYLSSYIADSGERRYLAVTDFESSDCRRMTPSFDEPDLKATWKISIIRQREYHSLSNMDLETTVTLSETWAKDIYTTSEIMSSYLVAFAVTDYLHEAADPTILNGKPVKAWGPPPLMLRGAGKYAPNLKAKALKFFQDYLEVNYTLPKMDSIAIPDFSAGAMENWGLNTYRIARLMYLEGINTVQEKVAMSSTIAHELAHQFFGNLVTMKWWNDIWLNEGFATYFATLVYRNGVYPEYEQYDLDDFIVVDSIQAAFRADVASTSHPLHAVNISSPSDISVLFDILTYDKGASLLRMTNAFLTEARFKAGLKEYLTQRQYSNAHQDQLFDALQSQADPTSLPNGLTVGQVLENWTTKTSYPVVHVSRVSGTRFKLEQEKMLLNKTNPPSDNEETIWSIPITYGTRLNKTNTNTRFWLTEKSSEFDVAADADNDYIIFNNEQTGYYRVKYDNDSLYRIIDELNKNHEEFDTKTRSALVDDSLALAFSGYSSIKEGLDMTKYLKNETTLMPWLSFFNNMQTVYRLLARTGGFLSFRTYARGLVTPTLNSIGHDETLGEHVSDRTLLRTRLYEWACNLGDSTCIAHANAKIDNWMTSSSDQIPNTAADIRPHVYCTAVTNHPNKAVFGFISKQYLKATHDTDQLNLLKSLACSRDFSTINDLLKSTLDPNSFILEAHRVPLMQYVAANSWGITQVFYFLKDNLDAIISRFGTSAIATVVSTLSNSFTQKFEQNDLIKFANNNTQLAGIGASLNASIANVGKNIDWMTKNAEELNNWFKVNA